jgi:hypothetical protein
MLVGLHHVGTLLIAPAGIEPATSGFKVQRPSPAETPGLQRDTARVSNVPVTPHAQRTRSHTSGPFRPNAKPGCREQLPINAGHLGGVTVLLEACRRRAQVPPPRTGIPHGDRVIWANVSGHHRNGSHFRVQRDSTSSDCPVASHADSVGTRRQHDPRLCGKEQAVIWGECPSWCEVTSVCVSSVTSLTSQRASCIKSVLGM